VLASALDYSRRRKIVTTDLDFPTVAYQWLAKRPLGVDVDVVRSPDGVTVPPDLLARAVDDRTALVATSHVFFTTGAIQDLRALAEAAHAHGALCFVDAYQSAGQVPLDVRASGVDFLCSGGLKWLLGGPGITFLYARRELIPRLEPTVTGWFAHARQLDFDPAALVWHQDARRLEQGTPALAAVHAQLGGLDVIDEIGVPAIRAATSQLTEDLVARAMDLGFTPRIAGSAAERSGIVMLPSANPRADVAALAARRIVADARPGHVRLSPYFYNVVEDHVAALETLRPAHR
jgi:selenocysteine lyase/cysteine desulfurase